MQTEVVVRLVQSDTVAFLAVSYKDGECSGHVATGVYLALGSNGTWAVYEDQGKYRMEGVNNASSIKFYFNSLGLSNCLTQMAGLL